MKLYKLTDEKYQTGHKRQLTQWGENVTHTAVGSSNSLCNSRWIHAYKDPYQALLMMPMHGINSSVMWDCDGDVGLDKPDKCGCTRLTTLHVIDQPTITTDMRVEFARLMTLEIYDLWSKYDKGKIVFKWLNGDRSINAAYAAYAADAAYAAADAAYAAAYGADLTSNRLIELAHKACKENGSA